MIQRGDPTPLRPLRYGANFSRTIEPLQLTREGDVVCLHHDEWFDGPTTRGRGDDCEGSPPTTPDLQEWVVALASRGLNSPEALTSAANLTKEIYWKPNDHDPCWVLDQCVRRLNLVIAAPVKINRVAFLLLGHVLANCVIEGANAAWKLPRAISGLRDDINILGLGDKVVLEDDSVQPHKCIPLIILAGTCPDEDDAELRKLAGKQFCITRRKPQSMEREAPGEFPQDEKLHGFLPRDTIEAPLLTALYLRSARDVMCDDHCLHVGLYLWIWDMINIDLASKVSFALAICEKKRSRNARLHLRRE